MMLRFDVAIILTQEEEESARLAHPDKFGWQLCGTRWYRKTVQGTATALLFWGLIEGPDSRHL